MELKTDIITITCISGISYLVIAVNLFKYADVDIFVTNGCSLRLDVPPSYLISGGCSHCTEMRNNTYHCRHMFVLHQVHTFGTYIYICVCMYVDVWVCECLCIHIYI